MKPLTVLLVLAFLQSIYAASLYAVAEHKDVVHLYSLDTNTKEAKLINTTTGKIDTGAPFVAREADVFAVGMAEDSQSAFMLHRDSAGKTTRGPINTLLVYYLIRKMGNYLG
jgi:hypothetical protein